MKEALFLIKKAREIRKSVILSLNAAGSGHLGGSLGLADVFSVLYFHEMKHKPEQPDWLDRERLILSIGHVAPVLYATLAESGYFDKEELLTLRKLGTRLQGHPGRDHGLPGVELSAGSLGQGLGVAVGIALMDQHEKKDKRTFCIMGDGELQEGSVWEAAMSAGHYKLHNIIGIVDRNNVQIDGKTEDVMSLEPLADKWRSFGWHVLECNGNDVEELIQAFAHKSDEKPTLILAHTKMGCGIPEIENDYTWHGKAPNGEEMERFLGMLVKNR
ncbi:MAG: transketolase [Bacteroidales bacterium]|nr:transketolase [Bacteroidales bacterium]